MAMATEAVWHIVLLLLLLGAQELVLASAQQVYCGNINTEGTRTAGRHSCTASTSLTTMKV